jgi:hypothetical protein
VVSLAYARAYSANATLGPGTRQPTGIGTVGLLGYFMASFCCICEINVHVFKPSIRDTCSRFLVCYGIRSDESLILDCQRMTTEGGPGRGTK